MKSNPTRRVEPVRKSSLELSKGNEAGHGFAEESEGYAARVAW